METEKPRYDPSQVLCKQHKKRLFAVSLDDPSTPELFCTQCVFNKKYKTLVDIRDCFTESAVIDLADKILSNLTTQRIMSDCKIQEHFAQIDKQFQAYNDHLNKIKYMCKERLLRELIRNLSKTLTVKETNSIKNWLLKFHQQLTQEKDFSETSEVLNQYWKLYRKFKDWGEQIEKKKQSYILKSQEVMSSATSQIEAFLSDLETWIKAKLEATSILEGFRYIASGAADRSLKIMDIDSKKIDKTFDNLHEDDIRKLVVAPNNQLIVTGSNDHTIKVIDLKKMQEVISFPLIHSDVIRWVDVSSNSRFIASCSNDHSIKLIDIESRKVIKSFDFVHQHWISCVKFTPDIKHMISSSYDCSVKVFGIASKRLLSSYNYVHKFQINSFEISPDSRFVITASDDRAIKFIDIKREKLVHSIFNVETEGLSQISLSKNKAFLAVGSNGGNIKLFNYITRKPILRISRQHNDTVSGLYFSPNSKFLVSSSFEGTIKVFNLITKKTATSFDCIHKGRIWSIGLIPTP